MAGTLAKKLSLRHKNLMTDRSPLRKTMVSQPQPSKNGKLHINGNNGNVLGTLEKVERESSTLGMKPPKVLSVCLMVRPWITGNTRTKECQRINF